MMIRSIIIVTSSLLYLFLSKYLKKMMILALTQ